MGFLPLEAMFLRILLIGLALYFLYKLVFQFIIPVVRTTRRVKRGFREMREKMEQHGAAYGQQQQPGPEKKKDIPGDYIEFEEVKD